jgi:hypothetical protein
MNGVYLVATWIAPSYNGGTNVIITSYRVKFMQSNGIFTEIPAECDGTQASVITALQCQVHMTTLLAAPFNLAEGNLIVVSVEALNAIGYSIPSLPNTQGQLAQVQPHAPTAKPIRGTITDESQIQIILTTVTTDGGSPLTSYAVEINDGITGFLPFIGDPVA